MDRTKPRAEVVWFSQFFGMELPQYELPFVDFNIHSDVPLYIDPYAITKDPTELAAHCHNAIISYFQVLIETIRSGNSSKLRQLIRGRLSEPTEIHLGVSKAARRGRGIGGAQEQQVVDALSNSEAARMGVIQAIQELELHIRGIGPDKISDLVANIILSYLAQFTEAACAAYGIATQPCAVSGFWNPERMEWDGGYFNLPAHETHSYVLVPKRFVRRERDLMNHRVFYRKYVLEVLERELITADDSLVETLKSGKRRVTKKAMSEDPRFALSKDFISQFIIEHPDAIDAYRNELWRSFNPTDPAVWSGKDAEDDPLVRDALADLDGLRAGREDASAYHETVFALVQFVFDWVLENFDMEYKMDQGRSRIDVIADNYAGGGLFAELREELNATSVPIECKNFATDLGNDEFNQLMDRLGPTTSRFGMLVCRTITDRAAMLKHQSDRWLRHQSLILLVDDALLKHLVDLRLAREFSAIESTLRKKIRAVRYGALDD